ncbi:hypothetical protein A4R26_30800 [Niastella populi]|uniref:Uncharacterized protein n=1 Tax=Niastella populi TaxID=550983 RepID=A0A1V9ETF0_9BACT|nr:hypothetical protein A4R26_30800 [Niastella populi]
MRDVAMPKRSPIAEQTPKACHSIKYLNRFMALNYNIKQKSASLHLPWPYFLGNFTKLFFIRLITS